jgi:hypothetical protein
MATAAQDIVDALDAAILAFALNPVQHISIGGRVRIFSSLPELKSVRDEYAALAARAANAGSSPFQQFGLVLGRPE